MIQVERIFLQELDPNPQLRHGQSLEALDTYRGVLAEKFSQIEA